MTKYIEARIHGGLIQEVAGCGPTGADGGYGEQQQANANLIAAAPDLLEALEAARNALGALGQTMGGTFAQIERAIAKAKGEAKC
jgi:hypothetical protein